MKKVLYKGYTVYDDGNVFDVFGNPAEVIYSNNTGYYSVKIIDGEGLKIWRLNRLVYTAFYGEIQDNLQIDHIDNDRSNNHIDNLQALTPSENSIKARANSDADRTVKTIQQWTLSGKLVAEYYSATHAEKETALTIKANHRRISECAHNRKDTHRGFVWKFKTHESLN